MYHNRLLRFNAATPLLFPSHAPAPNLPVRTGKNKLLSPQHHLQQQQQQQQQQQTFSFSSLTPQYQRTHSPTVVINPLNRSHQISHPQPPPPPPTTTTTQQHLLLPSLSLLPPPRHHQQQQPRRSFHSNAHLRHQFQYSPPNSLSSSPPLVAGRHSRTTAPLHHHHHYRPPSTLSSSTTSSPSPITQQRRNAFGIVQNCRNMDWDRVRRNWRHPFVWLEEYKLGRYRCDQKRMLFHSRRTGGIQPPYDPRRGQYIDEWEYLQILEREREERFWRMNIWRKANIFRRFFLSNILIRIVSIWNHVQDFVTRCIGKSTMFIRGYKRRERRIAIWAFWAIPRYPLQVLLRWLASFFFRLELQRNFTLKDLDLQMQNTASGELFAKYPWPRGYNVSKYLIALWEPIFNTFNRFHAIRLVWLNVIYPLFRRWWFHINDYKPYLGFVKFGLLQWALCFGFGATSLMWTRFHVFDHVSYAYKADFAHTYIALMTRAVYADLLIALIEDGLIKVDPLTEGHDFELHTYHKSKEFKFIDDEVKRRCDEDPEYRQQLEDEGIPVTLDQFYGIEGIPEHLPSKEQVLYILHHYNNYGSITREMLLQMRPLYDFIDKNIRILYSLGLVNETSWLNVLMGNISSPRVYLLAYRALLNIMGTRDGDTDDPSLQHGAMLRALTRKFDLTVLPPSVDSVHQMATLQRPYTLQFKSTQWDHYAHKWEVAQYEFYKKYHNDRPGSGLDVYHGADKSQYDPVVHGEHQFFDTLPSVTNGQSDCNLKGLGKAFFDPYVSILLPAFHSRPLDHEMVVLNQIKSDLIKLARISPEFKDEIPADYHPYDYKQFIQNYLRIYGSDKLALWEKMMGRDFLFETPNLTQPTADIAGQKHAKWLWSQVIACVLEKVKNNAFVSPMYYLEDTCPNLHDTPYRSKVDTTTPWQFRNDIGRPITPLQRRGIDYQMIDPYAEEHWVLIKEFKTNSNTWDFHNIRNRDSRIDRIYKTPGEDFGFWPGGQSFLPFTGVNKYRGSNPLTGYAGLLVTSAENLMTINRTVKDMMVEKTDEGLQKPKYDPFGPQYLQSDWTYTNQPSDFDPKDPESFNSDGRRDKNNAIQFVAHHHHYHRDHHHPHHSAGNNNNNNSLNNNINYNPLITPSKF